MTPLDILMTTSIAIGFAICWGFAGSPYMTKLMDEENAGFWSMLLAMMIVVIVWPIVALYAFYHRDDEGEG